MSNVEPTGRFDIAYITPAMSRFKLALREGHLKAAKKILAYLKTFPYGRVIIDTSYPRHSEYPVKDHPNCEHFYPDAKEEMPNNLPVQMGPKVRTTVYVDADHAHDFSYWSTFRLKILFILFTYLLKNLLLTLPNSTYGLTFMLHI
jgi:hypothetical protein